MANLSPQLVPDNLIETWRQTQPGSAGYDASRKCYCWGFRPAYNPPQINVIGLGGYKWSAQTWSICPDNKGGCACVAPPAPKCPACPTCPVCKAVQPTTAPAKCPVCATPQPPQASAAPPGSDMAPVAAPEPTWGSKWGVTLGWLLGAAAVGGGGYFMYKKGAFKRK